MSLFYGAYREWFGCNWIPNSWSISFLNSCSFTQVEWAPGLCFYALASSLMTLIRSHLACAIPCCHPQIIRPTTILDAQFMALRIIWLNWCSSRQKNHFLRHELQHFVKSWPQLTLSKKLPPCCLPSLHELANSEFRNRWQPYSFPYLWLVYYRAVTHLVWMKQVYAIQVHSFALLLAWFRPILVLWVSTIRVLALQVCRLGPFCFCSYYFHQLSASLSELTPASGSPA